MNVRMLLGATLLIATALPSPRASAQACDDGRVRVSGFCCWPGQRWSGAQCEGPPRCPEGMSEEGLGCVPPVAPALAAPVTTVVEMVAPEGASVGATSATTTEGWPILPGARPDGVLDPVMRRGADDGLIFGGLITFAVGYLGGLAMGVADAASANCRDPGASPAGTPPWQWTPVGCGTGAFSFIPLVGATLSNSFGDYRDSSGVGLGFGVPVGVAQIVGLWIFLHGIAGYTMTLDEAQVHLGNSATLRLELSAPSSDAGLTATIDF